MEIIQEIIIRKNFKHVATIINKNGDIEELSDGPVNLDDVIHGMAELNRNGISLLKIQTGKSNEDVTKIKNIVDMGLYKDGMWIKKPSYDDTTLSENEVIPFKSDSWVLGEYIVKKKTGKCIPKRFLKSQKLLDTFSGDDEILKKLLVIDHSRRMYTWEIYPENNQGGCIIH